MRKRTKQRAAIAAVAALCLPLSACGTVISPVNTEVLPEEKTQTVVVGTEVEGQIADNSVVAPVLPVAPISPAGSTVMPDAAFPDMSEGVKNDAEVGVSEWDGDLKKAGWGSETRVAKPDGFKSITRDGVLEIEIESAEALAYLSHEIYAYNEDYLGCRVTLCCDIDLKNQLWIPIGFDNRDKSTLDHAFKGKIEETTADIATETDGQTLKAGFVKDGEKYYKVTNAVFDANGHTIKNLDGNAFIDALNNTEDGTIYLKYGDIRLDVEVNHDHEHHATNYTTASGKKLSVESDSVKSAKIEFHYGLFDVVANAEIKDLTVENFKFDYPEEKQVKSNCSHTYNVLNEDKTDLVAVPCDCKCTYVADSVGAIVGYAGGGLKLVNCTAGSERSDKTETDFLYGAMCSGGLVGRVYHAFGFQDGSVYYSNSANIKCSVEFNNCVNYINVGSDYTDKKGGIMAYANSKVAGSMSAVLVFENCVNYGDIKAEDAGGITSYLQPTGDNAIIFRNCINEGAIYGIKEASGIIGRIDNAKSVTVEKCINRGDIFAVSNANDVFCAGIEGKLHSTILAFADNFNYGNIKVINKTASGAARKIYIGGLSGQLSSGNGSNVISGGNCGKVEYVIDESATVVNNLYIGGCIGQTSGTFTQNYLVNAYQFPKTEDNN